ncbi:hypothetical protein MASR2M78_24480 [Treponema sp.]
MYLGNFELYNIAELLHGSGLSVLQANAKAAIAAGQLSEAVWADEDDEGRWLSRLPEMLRTKLNAHAQVNALQTTGAEIRFTHLSGPVHLSLKTAQAPSILEVYYGPFFSSWHAVGTSATQLEILPPANLDELARISTERGLPFDAHLCRILLPWRPPCHLIALEGDVVPPREDQVPKNRYLAYGSSITHGNHGMRPSGNWAFRLAQLLGVDLINLGFGAGAYLESEIADYIASREDWDYMTAEFGINLIEHLPLEQFAHRVDDFLSRLVPSLSGRKLFVIDMFGHFRDFRTEMENAPAYRAIVESAVRQLAHPNIIHVRGLELLSSPEHLTADLLHPSPAGMEEIARNLSPVISHNHEAEYN